MEHLNLNLSCNQNCMFCILDRFHGKNRRFVKEDSRQGISIEQAKEKIDRIADNKITDVLTFLGAEPTVRPGLIELVDYARQKNIKIIEISTNCIKLADKDYARKLIHAGVDRIVTSLHSYKPKLCDKIVGVKGNFNKIIAGIKNSIELGVDLRITHVIFSQNYRDILSFIRFCEKNFPKIIYQENMEPFTFLYLQSPVIIEKAEKERIDWIRKQMPRFSETSPYIYEAMKYLKSKQIRFTVEGIPLCYLKGFFENSIDFHEALDDKIVHIKQDPNSSEILHAKTFLDLRSKGIECQFCSKNNLCYGAWQEYVQLYGTGEFIPIL
ncbi:radical SAM protein [Candidatus Woesearchaeota archaeon]|nr:radical SAM protein [Candidatus Woesearchaeota archaeon]